MIKKTFYKTRQYFPLYKSCKGNVKVGLDFSNYAIKTDLKSVTHVDVSNFSLKTNLASLKTEVVKMGVDKLKTILADLSKLSNVVNKKTFYDKLVAKGNNIDTK